MLKPGRSPARSRLLRRIRIPSEWNVEMERPFADFAPLTCCLNMAETRDFISRAALLVKVTAVIVEGFTF